MNETERLAALLYDEMRVIARDLMRRERPGHTLQTTALVHEAYLRLRGPDGAGPGFETRGHFMASAARAMRRILVDHARQKKAKKRDADELPRIETPRADLDDQGILALDAALERLESQDPDMAEVVHLRYFAGLTLEQTAEALSVSVSTVKRDWECARRWLAREMERS